MNEATSKIVFCAIRTVGAIALLLASIWGAKYLEIGYDDVRVLLGIVNAYGPELSGVFLFAAIGVAFFRASRDESNAFKFVGFFLSDRPENVGKLIYFLLGVTVMWSYFALFWREKLETTYVVGTGFLFIVQGVAALAGKTVERIKSAEGEKP